MRVWPMMAAAVLVGAPVRAERELCSDRPGQGTSACTVDPGTLQLEASIADYAHTRDTQEVEHRTLIGDMLLRYGIADHAELRFGWTAYGFDRTRDRKEGSVDRRHGTGDISIGFRRNIVNPDGKGVAFAVQPFVTAPTGHTPIGAGTWGAGILAPVTAELGDDWSATLDTEVDAAPDEDGGGRHLAYSAVVDLNRKLGEQLTVTAEGFVRRDSDPSDHATLATADIAAAYQIGEDSQIDFAVYRGLNDRTPRVELILGVVRRFH